VQEEFCNTRRHNTPHVNTVPSSRELRLILPAVALSSLQNSTRKGLNLDPNERFSSWLSALEARHLSDLTPSEAARALRALSSCYVERRARLAEGAALATAGKRAAFALFYGPLHFLVTREVIRALRLPPVRAIIDAGCGTGAAGAAWALDVHAAVTGFDRHAWAVAEAAWTYRTLGLLGRTRKADIARVEFEGKPGLGILAAYAINELNSSARALLLPRLIKAVTAHAHVLILEPIARRQMPWWNEWEDAFLQAGGRTDEWRFPASLPPRQLQLARAAGLQPRELTARSLSV
jgi:hypothetical protein